MLLRNFYNLLALSMFNYSGTSAINYGDGYLNLKRESDGQILFAYHNNTNNRPSHVGLAAASFVFGNGTTTETFEDYRLESKNTDITKSNESVYGLRFDDINKTWVLKKMCNLQNNTDSNITITEVGLVSNYTGRTSNVATSGASGTYLIYREVLDEPFTVKAGETVVYTHEIKFHFPTM